MKRDERDILCLRWLLIFYFVEKEKEMKSSSEVCIFDQGHRKLDERERGMVWEELEEYESSADQTV